MQHLDLGIFAVMSMCVMIVLSILAARFIYVDRAYKNLIKEHEITIEETKKNIYQSLEEKNKDGNTNMEKFIGRFDEFVSARTRSIGMYYTKQENNIRTGVLSDIVTVIMITLVAFVTVAFNMPIMLVGVFSLALIFVSATNFATHIIFLIQERSSTI